MSYEQARLDQHQREEREYENARYEQEAEAQYISQMEDEITSLRDRIEKQDKRISELEAKLERVRELPARGTQSAIMIGGYWINRADLMEALADDE